MKYFLIAGEASGDLLGSMLMQALKKYDKSSDFRYWGGDKMIEQGGNCTRHISKLSIMGFTQVLVNLPVIIRNFKQIRKELKDYKPDVLILIDFPGFNLRVAKIAKNLGIEVSFYVSPTVWAWHESRVKTIKKYVDSLFVLLPFEKEFYKKHNYDVIYEGHPIIDSIKKEKEAIPEFEEFITQSGLNDKAIIALLPGSRLQEVKRILPVMVKIVSSFPDFQFVVAATSLLPESVYNSICEDYNVVVLYDKTSSLQKHAHTALVTSGTATLETALFNTPEVVCYKTGKLSFSLAKFLVNIKFISLVNLIMQKEIVKELIQSEFTVENLETELGELVNDSTYRGAIMKNYLHLHDKLGDEGVSDRIAIRIVNSIKS